MKPFSFHGMTVPEDTIESINRYVVHGIPTGGFLEAVICNDLKGAVGRANEWNMRCLPAIVAYLYNECPAPCWGHAEAFDNWLERKREEAKEFERHEKAIKAHFDEATS